MTSRMQRGMTTRTGDVVGWCWSGGGSEGPPPARWSLRRRLALGVAGLGLASGLALGLGFLAFVAGLARAERLPLGPPTASWR